MVATPNATTLYWSLARQLADMTCNGASIRTGDPYGTVKISSADAGYSRVEAPGPSSHASSLP